MCTAVELQTRVCIIYCTTRQREGTRGNRQDTQRERVDKRKQRQREQGTRGSSRDRERGQEEAKKANRTASSTIIHTQYNICHHITIIAKTATLWPAAPSLVRCRVDLTLSERYFFIVRIKEICITTENR